jgi:hypothetical protein
MDDAPEIIPSKKRRAVELGEMALKKRRLHGEVATHDVPDLSSLTRRSLREMTATDRLLSSGHLPYLGHPEWYPGFSKKAKIKYKWMQANPTATDPGGAEIGFVSDRPIEQGGN